ncbi:hypothetical protein B0O99DRAFT_614749 [Bisporella sp. PMI_857]|nr:hypothetical protein B0O99DRAFT_614749 [Bisporella sp. PMI_857]
MLYVSPDTYFVVIFLFTPPSQGDIPECGNVTLDLDHCQTCESFKNSDFLGLNYWLDQGCRASSFVPCCGMVKFH